MKDEIKEILNNADSSTKFKMVDEDGTEKEMNIAGLIEKLLNDNRNLLDYITNLQCDVDSYKTKYNNAKNNLKVLQEENEELNRMCELYGKSLYNAELQDYKSRNEKAIEYILVFKDDIRGLDDIVLLNILQGSDK